MTDRGHNSNAQLKSIVERFERLEESKAEIAGDIKELCTEAKSAGYDVPALRQLVKEKREDKAKRDKRAEREAILDTYRAALGQLSDTPLGAAALERVG
jgi:uncharacterized protein (UPF0335 family)